MTQEEKGAVTSDSGSGTGRARGVWKWVQIQKRLRTTVLDKCLCPDLNVGEG